MISWNDSLTALKNIGAKKAERFQQLGIATIGDLLYYAPFRYEDWAAWYDVSTFQEDGMTVMYYGEVIDWKQIQWRPGRILIKALLSGEQGDLVAVWFNRPHLHKAFEKGLRILLSGKIQLRHGKQVVVERHFFIHSASELKKLARIRPVYRGTEKLKSMEIERSVQQALEEVVPRLSEVFPESVLRKNGLLPICKAFHALHFPEYADQVIQARQTLVVYELLALLLWVRDTNPFSEIGLSHCAPGKLHQAYIDQLPYDLTPAQQKVVDEILSDMRRPKQMHRLLQGDVGSGKTSVAVIALLQAVESGYQAVMMAPTEVLARQHFEKIRHVFSNLNVNLTLLTGQMKAAEKKEALEAISCGDTHVVFGTHALIEEGVVFQNLGLVVIDEQHRFGVRQRQALENKAQHPDVLVMTATPIPRSLALTVYGNLDVSVIDALPPGRGTIQTMWIGEAKRQDMYGFVEKELRKGRQAYVVCPMIGESNKLDTKNVQDLAHHLQTTVFPGYRIAVLHGRMSGQEKDTLMTDFYRGKINLLVSTTVIEVGIDVANATVMIIENAERFGLAQLHQLRGRIGRGSEKSYCILISESQGEDTTARLRTLVQSNDGFVIAEADLKQRGAGELLGLRQHGYNMFRLADLSKDMNYVNQAHALLADQDQLDSLWRHRFLADLHRRTIP